jgi:hypothetical protein
MTATGGPDLHIPEIVDSILGFLDLADSQDARALVSCRNVSSIFLRSAQKSTFHSVALVLQKDAKDGFSCSRFLTALSRYPEIALFVKHLHLEANSASTVKEDILELPDILELLNNLESISMTNICYAFTELVDLIRSVTCREDVRHISFHGWSSGPSSRSIYSVLLNGANGVKDLDIQDKWNITPRDFTYSIPGTIIRAIPSFPGPGPLPRVRALKVLISIPEDQDRLFRNLVSSQPVFDLDGLESIKIQINYVGVFLLLQYLLHRTQRSLRSLRIRSYYSRTSDSRTQWYLLIMLLRWCRWSGSTGRSLSSYRASKLAGARRLLLSSPQQI